MGAGGPTVVIRADGGRTLGLGHVIRCLALAEALTGRGAAVTFLTRTTEPAVLARLERAPCAVERLPGGDEAAAVGERARGAAAVVIDVYGVTVACQEAVRRAGARLLVIDDLAQGRFVADLVLNQNLGARPEAYDAAPHTRLLLGPRYALLRRAFRGVVAAPARPPRVLVTMGGADPGNVTARALEALDALPDAFALDVVLGAAFAHADVVAAVAARSTHPVAVHRDPPDLPGLMARATLAVSAAGSTCWELAHLGVPAVVVGLAANQASIAAALDAAGVARSAGAASPFPAGAVGRLVAALLADASGRARMAAAGRALVDGGGAARTAEALLAA
jgi:UDP-2,4-diacetamido-2,4,6-trideoxy-beta-L-altropyranose hydrolase